MTLVERDDVKCEINDGLLAESVLLSNLNFYTFYNSKEL